MIERAPSTRRQSVPCFVMTSKTRPRIAPVCRDLSHRDPGDSSNRIAEDSSSARTFGRDAVRDVVVLLKEESYANRNLIGMTSSDAKRSAASVATPCSTSPFISSATTTTTISDFEIPQFRRDMDEGVRCYEVFILCKVSSARDLSRSICVLPRANLFGLEGRHRSPR